jgi:hypothetical protein
MEQRNPNETLINRVNKLSEADKIRLEEILNTLGLGMSNIENADESTTEKTFLIIEEALSSTDKIDMKSELGRRLYTSIVGA